MGNRLGTFQLELHYLGQDEPTVLGTDGIMTIDGRWTNYRAYETIREFAQEYCDRHNSHGRATLEWRGSVYLLGGRCRSITVPKY